MRALTAGTTRAVFHHFRIRDYFLEDQLLSTPHLYFLYLKYQMMITTLSPLSPVHAWSRALRPAGTAWSIQQSAILFCRARAGWRWVTCQQPRCQLEMWSTYRLCARNGSLILAAKTLFSSPYAAPGSSPKHTRTLKMDWSRRNGNRRPAVLPQPATLSND